MIISFNKRVYPARNGHHIYPIYTSYLPDLRANHFTVMSANHRLPLHMKICPFQKVASLNSEQDQIKLFSKSFVPMVLMLFTPDGCIHLVTLRDAPLGAYNI